MVDVSHIYTVSIESYYERRIGSTQGLKEFGAEDAGIGKGSGQVVDRWWHIEGR